MSGTGVIYGLVFFSVWWAYQGYILYLAYNKKKISKYSAIDKDYFFSIIVPTFNENDLVVKKIESLKNLSYPRYEVFFADASTDQTADRIRKYACDSSRVSLLECAITGRCQQINTALKQAKGDLILISDCDGMMPPDALEKLAGHFRDDEVAVVGGCIMPGGSYKNDLIFWQSQNAVRFLESDYGHCASISGVCYAFRRSLLDSLPAGVWSDDIYVPLLANTLGFSCIYADDLEVLELRTPQNLGEFIKHKMRKGQDYIKELLRFLPMSKRMQPRWLVVFATRFLLVVILPWLVIAFGMLFIISSAAVKLCSLFIVIISGLCQWHIVKKRYSKNCPVSFIRLAGVFLLTNGIIVKALLSYMLRGGRIRYEKI
jgi:poly-beta-1,6-N-acetyl-D-glucosamine synthase